MMFVDAMDELRNFDVMSLMRPFLKFEDVTFVMSSRVTNGVMTIGGGAEKSLQLDIIRYRYKQGSCHPKHTEQKTSKPGVIYIKKTESHFI